MALFRPDRGEQHRNGADDAGWDKARIAERVEELTTLVGLDHALLDRYPDELSVGSSSASVWRSACCRSSGAAHGRAVRCRQPIVRARLQDELLDLQTKVRKTIVLVTHDVDEALRLADRIALMNIGGVVEQLATPLMPRVMKLAPVQFLSWFALFAMWIYTTAAVTEHHFGTTDTTSVAYNDGANWVGVLFAAYNGFAALAALFIPKLAATLGRRRAHLVGLWCGAVGLISIRFIDDPRMLLVSMVGVGIAVVHPSVALRNAVAGRAAQEDGHLHGNPQFLHRHPADPAASVLGIVVRVLFDAQSIDALALGGVLMFLAGLAMLRVDDREER